MLRNPFFPTGRFALSFLALICACATPEEKSERSGQNAEKDPRASVVYIGEMHYFRETGEFYTSLYYHPDYEGKRDRALIGLLDSTVYQRKPVTRRRLPIELAKNIFFLNGLDSLLVYDTDHRFISEVSLARVEFVEDGADERFVAVYHGGKLRSEPSEEYYCMDRFLKENFIENFSHTVVNNPSLDDYLLHRLNIRRRIDVEIQNISVAPGGATYSVVTTPESSFLTEVQENSFTVLKTMNVRYRISNILPLPFQVNNKPLLLASLYIPGQPDRPVSLAVFADFQEYRFLNYNRLSLKKSPDREVRFMQNP